MRISLIFHISFETNGIRDILPLYKVTVTWEMSFLYLEEKIILRQNTEDLKSNLKEWVLLTLTCNDRGKVFSLLHKCKDEEWISQL